MSDQVATEVSRSNHALELADIRGLESECPHIARIFKAIEATKRMIDSVFLRRLCSAITKIFILVAVGSSISMLRSTVSVALSV